MTSSVATEVVRNELSKILPDAIIEQIIIADGGEGTLEMYQKHFNAKIEVHEISDPIGEPILAKIGYVNNETAIIETPQAIGLSLVKGKPLNPYYYNSYGVGELIKIAVRNNAKKVYVTMGDSSTLEMGVGMLSALGVRFFSSEGEIFNPKLYDLNQIIDYDNSSLEQLIQNITFIGLVDTNDYLCGELGQVQLYGRQKGLKDEDISLVEKTFLNFSELIKKKSGIDVLNLIRSSGSGGLAATLNAFLGAKLYNTLDYIAPQLNMDDRIKEADIIITGEGCLDHQTKQGKVPYYVAKRSTGYCIGIFGNYTNKGFEDILNVCPKFSAFTMNNDLSIYNPIEALKQTVQSIGRLLKLSIKSI